MIVCALLAIGLVLVGCPAEDTGGGTNTSENGTGGNGDNTNGNGTGGEATFTPPTKAQIEAFVENHRKNTTLMGGSAAVYVKSITINSYTVAGKNITTKPSPVLENAEVQVKFTLRTILSFNNLTMGERLNIDNYRIDLLGDLTDWLQEQGFGRLKITITTGNTVFG
jgi:hypothetical protein